MMIVIYILVALLLIVLLLAASKPKRFRIERRIIVNARAAEVFALVNDFHLWQLWSPWETMDPALKRQYRGPTAGLGSVYEWEGNKNVGKGRMEIIETKIPEKILIQLDFLAPFQAHNQAEFTFTEQASANQEGSSTSVSCVMSGPNLFVGKIMGVFCDMDRMVGKNFETGLANLKRQVESQQKRIPA